jgi:DNA-binding NarL/FixJ family response regulator
MLTSSDQHPDVLEAAGQLLPGESLAIEASHGLTDHEAQVLRMIARGYRNREIAAVLFISEPTVKRYTQQIYRKLGARDRAHAAALANRFRLD